MNNNEWPKPKNKNEGLPIAGVKTNPDSSKDFSKAAYVMEGDSREKESKDQQRENVINGRIKAQIAANPDKVVDVEQARKYWEGIYDEPGQPGKPNSNRAEMQMNEIYAQKHENSALIAREKILKLEADANKAKSEEERQLILEEIVKQRNFAQEMENEAKARRNSFQPIPESH